MKVQGSAFSVQRSGFKVWVFALRAWGYALWASGYDPTRRPHKQGLRLKGYRYFNPYLIKIQKSISIPPKKTGAHTVEEV